MLATLASLLAAIGGSDMSVQYICNTCKHAPIRRLRVVEAGSVCDDDPSIQQSSPHVTTFILLSTSMPSFQPLVQYISYVHVRLCMISLSLTVVCITEA